MRAGLAAALAVVALAPLAARAQQGGTYVGTLANGDAVRVLVTANPNGPSVVTGLYVVPGNAIHCTPHPARLDSEFGVGGYFVVLNDAATVATQTAFETFAASLTFTGSTVAGTVAATLPAFTKYERMPFTAALCVLPSTGFSATLTAAP
jgi:hypothetical protein